MDRRQFLIRSAATGGLTAGALGGLGGLATPALAQMTPPTDYRALVCLFLFGGNDSFNMLVPRSAAEYAAYARSRQNLAIAQSSLLPILPLTSDGAQYGLHPRMPEMARLFDAGRLALVANTGPLIRPVTKAEILGGGAQLPPQLFSHNDQQDQWLTLQGRQDLRSGWAGRAADALAADLAAQRVATNISLSGTSVFQIGDTTQPYTVSNDGAPSYLVLSPGAALFSERRAMFERVLALQQPSPISRAYSAVHQRALLNADRVNEALAAAVPIATRLPQSELGRQLTMVARLISARQQLAMRRQIFFVAIGGFDTHDDQNRLQPNLLGDLSTSLAGFYDALAELRVDDQVTTFTQSDFGRTLTSNGDGTDHGWGGHQLVLGGAVRGREIYGRMPRLEIGGPEDVGAGRMIPSTSVEQYAATLLRWFGLSDPQIDAAAPSLRNFATRNLGFV